MDLGQQGVVQTVSNQSINHFVLRKNRARLKAVAGCIGTEENILFVKPFCFMSTCILQPSSEIIGQENYTLCASQFISMKSSSE